MERTEEEGKRGPLLISRWNLGGSEMQGEGPTMESISPHSGILHGHRSAEEIDKGNGEVSIHKKVSFS